MQNNSINPPESNINLEASILSAMMIGDESAVAVLSEMKREYFFDGKNRKIFDIMYKLYRESKKIDLAIIVAELTSEDTDLILLINQISDINYSSTNAFEYYKKLKDIYSKKKLFTELNKISLSLKDTSITDIQTKLSELITINEIFKGNETLNIDQIIYNNIEEKAKESRSLHKKVYSQYQNIDQLMDFKRGEVYTLAGRPGQGKTSFAVSMLWNMAKCSEKYKCVYFTNETSKRQTIEKILQFRTGYSDKELQNLNLNEYQEKSTNLYDYVKNENIFLKITDSAFNVRKITNKIKVLHDLNGLDFVVIDLLNKLKLDRTMQKTYEIEDIYIEFGKIAIACNIPILIVAQLRRSASNQDHVTGDENDKPEPRPLLTDLKNSGAIEESSAGVFMLWRPHFKNKDHLEHNIAKVALGKGRYCGEGTFEYYFNNKTTHFTQKTDEFMGF